MTGTFRMQAGGPGGTVTYSWVYKDTNTIAHSGSVVVAAGDTSAHAISDSYVHPLSAGTVYLVFTSPSYASSSLQWSWTCR